MGLKTLMQTPTPPNMPNFSDKILNVNKIGDTGGTYGEGIFSGQPVRPGGFPRIPNPIQHTGIGPGHPDYQGGALQQVLPPKIQLPPGQSPILGRPSPMPIIGNDEDSMMKVIGGPQPDYSSQFSGFGDQLGGFGKQLTGFGDQLGGLGNQMTGYQDALGGFNEQVGGFGKQFENLNTRLDSMEKGIASLGEQFQPQPQQQQNPYANFYSNSNPFGSSMYGGLGSMMRYF